MSALRRLGRGVYRLVTCRFLADSSDTDSDSEEEDDYGRWWRFKQAVKAQVRRKAHWWKKRQVSRKVGLVLSRLALPLVIPFGILIISMKACRLAAAFVWWVCSGISGIRNRKLRNRQKRIWKLLSRRENRVAYGKEWAYNTAYATGSEVQPGAEVEPALARDTRGEGREAAVRRLRSTRGWTSRVPRCRSCSSRTASARASRMCLSLVCRVRGFFGDRPDAARGRPGPQRV